MDFLPEIPLFKYFCGCVPLKIGSMILGAIEIIVGAAHILSCILIMTFSEIRESFHSLYEISNKKIFFTKPFLNIILFISVFSKVSSESIYIDVCLTTVIFGTGIILIVGSVKVRSIETHLSAIKGI